MKLSVTYEDGEPIAISSSKTNDHRFYFTVEGSSAVLDDVEISHWDGDAPAKLDVKLVDTVLEEVEELPFVQAVTLDEYTEEEQ